MSITSKIDSALCGYANAVRVSCEDVLREKIEQHVDNFANDLLNWGDVTTMSHSWAMNKTTLQVSWIAIDQPMTVSYHEYEFSHLGNSNSTNDPDKAYERAMRGI